jgi:hypothetical protein
MFLVKIIVDSFTTPYYFDIRNIIGESDAMEAYMVSYSTDNIIWIGKYVFTGKSAKEISDKCLNEERSKEKEVSWKAEVITTED